MNADQLKAMRRVLEEVESERRRQHVKWGEQNHPNGTSWDAWVIQRDLAKAETDAAAREGEVTFRHILMEEVFEAFAETDPAKLRAELLQVAAVACQWVECLDRRAKGARHA